MKQNTQQIEDARAKAINEALENTPAQISITLFALAVAGRAYDAGSRGAAWICSEDDMPKTETVCWVTVDDGSVDGPTTFEAYWDGRDFVTNDNYAADIGTVTAWMEHFTPEPFQPSSGENI